MQPHFLLGLDKLVRQLAEMTLTALWIQANKMINAIKIHEIACSLCLEGPMMTTSVIDSAHYHCVKSQTMNTVMLLIIKYIICAKFYM